MSRIYSDHKVLENIVKIEGYNSRVFPWLKSLPT